MVKDLRIETEKKNSSNSTCMCYNSMCYQYCSSGTLLLQTGVML